MERMEKQLTAVDSLIKSILSFIDRSKVSDMMLQDIVSDHLAMEKEQMLDIYIGHNQYNDKYETFDEYYNETFKSE